MAFNSIDRTRCFSLGDFHAFEKCFFDFLVKHHLQKKYELAEGSENQAIGTLLDLAIKKLHLSKAYDQPLVYLLNSLFKAAELDIREQAEREGPNSFYGSTTKFLTPEIIAKAQGVFKNYYEKKKGKINKSIINPKFWQVVLEGDSLYKVWGGPDVIEIGEDGVVEIVDYKFRNARNLRDSSGNESLKHFEDHYDMDLMPKLYTLLCTSDLIKLGYKKARFRVRAWHDPLNDSLYEEFNLDNMDLLKDFFKQKIEKILSVTELAFCEKPYCKSCNSDQRNVWIKELNLKKFI